MTIPAPSRPGDNTIRAMDAAIRAARLFNPEWWLNRPDIQDNLPGVAPDRVLFYIEDTHGIISIVAVDTESDKFARILVRSNLSPKGQRALTAIYQQHREQ